MAKRRKRPVAAFDLDGSLVREQLLVLLTKECFELQIFRRVAEVVFKDIRLEHRDRKVSFEVYDRKLIELFTQRIKGKLRSDVEIAAEHVAKKHRDWLYVFTKTLLARLRDTHDCITITGAMIETVGPLAEYWGFGTAYATELEVDDFGRYTGRDLKLPVADKKNALLEHVAACGCTLKGSVAIGDTGSDIPMLEAVEMPIAFNPNDVLAGVAETNGWPIVIERKDCIYVVHACGGRRFARDGAADAVEYVLSLKRCRPAGG